MLQRGRYRREFLLERGIYRVLLADGSTGMVMFFGIPRGLVKGRSAWNIFTSCCEFFPLLRKQGHTGIICSVYALDGVLFESMLRKAEARHALFYDRKTGPRIEGDRELMRDSDWVLGIRCKAHGCSNGVSWGLRRQREIVDEDVCHIVVKSLVNSSEGLHLYIDTHIERNVDFRAEKTDAAVAEEFWRFLDIPDSFLSLFVEVDPQWDGVHTVWINPSLSRDPKFFPKVSVVIAHCFRWFNWSDTRWVKSGKASRKYLRSEACGVKGAVEVLASCTSERHHIGGYRKGSRDVRVFFCCAAFCTLPAERVLWELLTDDRILLRRDFLLQQLHEGVEYALNISDKVMQRIAALVDPGMDWRELRQTVHRAVLVTAGYVYRDVFKELFTEPLSATQGDLLANVREIGQQTRKWKSRLWQQIQRLVAKDLDEAEIVRGLKLLRQIPGMIGLVEEGHASGAMLMRAHPTATPKSLKCRAKLVMRRLTYAPPEWISPYISPRRSHFLLCFSTIIFWKFIDQ